jgi:hypothetical protein
MVRVTISFLLAVLLLASCKDKAWVDPLTEPVKIEGALEDYRTFRKILEDSHPALTEYLSEERKNLLFDSVYQTIQSPTSLRDYFNKISFLLNEIGCSHSCALLPQKIVDTLYGHRVFFPFPVIFLGDGIYVNSDHELPHGSKLLLINDRPVSQVLESLSIYNPVEGLHRETQRYLAANDFAYDFHKQFGAYEKFSITYQDTLGKIRSGQFNGIAFEDIQERHAERYYYDLVDINYSMRVNDEAHYATIRICSFGFGSNHKQTAFENFLKNSFELLASKKHITDLIIDVRENGGGDLYNCFLLYSYLSEKPFSEYKQVSTHIHDIPRKELLSDYFDPKDETTIETQLEDEFKGSNETGLYTPDSLIGKWTPDSSRFKGRVYIITNAEVMSSASYFTLLVKNSGRGVVVGVETCGGSYSGNGYKTLRYKLPSTGIRFEFAYANMVYFNNSPKTGRGVLPDYNVPDTYESFSENEDQQLIFILDSLLSKNR